MIYTIFNYLLCYLSLKKLYGLQYIILPIMLLFYIYLYYYIKRKTTYTATFFLY